MKYIIIILLLFLNNSCVTRISIPKIEGYIYENKTFQPIKDVDICINNECVKSNVNGYFQINKKTYTEKIMIGGEAPPVIYKMSISKFNYKDSIIYYKNLYGGGNTNLIVKYDSIILRKQ